MVQAQRQADIAAAQAKGQGDAARARAEGEAAATRLRADAEEYYNVKVASSLSPVLINQMYAEMERRAAAVHAGRTQEYADAAAQGGTGGGPHGIAALDRHDRSSHEPSKTAVAV